MFITNSKCLLCVSGLSPGSCCEITELDWDPMNPGGLYITNANERSMGKLGCAWGPFFWSLS